MVYIDIYKYLQICLKKQENMEIYIQSFSKQYFCQEFQISTSF